MVMGIIGRIFGSKNSTEKIIDSAIGGIDSIFTTKEEKIGFIADHLKNTAPFKILQRLLVLSITWVYLLLMLVASGFVVYYGIKKGDDVVDGLTKIVVDWNLGYAFMSVVTIYIGGGVLKMKK